MIVIGIIVLFIGIVIMFSSLPIGLQGTVATSGGGQVGTILFWVGLLITIIGGAWKFVAAE